jgi:hypothetical protein
MTITAASARYWRASRAPRYSLTFAFPLLVAYEALAFTLSHSAMTGVRNGADVLLKSAFVVLGGRNGLIVFGVLLVGTGAVLAWRDRKRAGPMEARVFGLMALESALYALLFGVVVGTLTGLLLRPFHPAVAAGIPAEAAHRLSLQGSLAALALPAQLMISLGAGLYEELLFRVLLVGGLAWLAGRLFGWRRGAAGIFATIVGALVFSAFHYVGPYGDRLELTSFLFRTVAGVLFSALYLLRGFGITAWTHALYDIFVALAW